MKVLVAADSHVYRSEDGRYWCKTIYGYDFWKRYLEVFETVKVVTRVGKIASKDTRGMLRVDGPGVEIFEMPFLRGMIQYIAHYRELTKAVKLSIEDCECAIFRLPSVVAFMVLKYFSKANKPFAVEVVADPVDAYAENKIARLMYTRKLKLAVKDANGVSYVTKNFLQNRYPSHVKTYGENNNYFETYYSSIDLEQSFFGKMKKYESSKGEFTIVHTANSINSDIKGHSTMIKILKKLIEKGYDAKVIFIGDGDKRCYFENLAKELGIGDKVYFTGWVKSKHEIREILIGTDIFVFPTKAEGLPRALIEAMAVGLPCLSTPVNGIPELLDKEFMFKAIDINGFTDKLIFLFNNTMKLEEMSRVNLEKAKEYTIEKLSLRRHEFYSKLRAITKKINKY
jgi:glycosyltransferase involved in cell wall biosynthesis